MKERPILFSAPMVRAILAGTKTQTRRALRDQPCMLPYFNRGHLSIRVRGAVYQAFSPNFPPVRCPYGQPGDRLWVRETWLDLQGTGVEYRDRDGRLQRCAYGADTPPGSHGDEARKDYGLKWRPSIHMPRWANRITLEITGVRVERLQDISEADAISEGIESAYESWRDYRTDPAVNFPCADSPISSYQTLWESINGTGSWDANPWVWVLEFKRIERSAA